MATTLMDAYHRRDQVCEKRGCGNDSAEPNIKTRSGQANQRALVEWEFIA